MRMVEPALYACIICAAQATGAPPVRCGVCGAPRARWRLVVDRAYRPPPARVRDPAAAAAAPVPAAAPVAVEPFDPGDPGDPAFAPSPARPAEQGAPWPDRPLEAAAELVKEGGAPPAAPSPAAEPRPDSVSG